MNPKPATVSNKKKINSHTSKALLGSSIERDQKISVLPQMPFVCHDICGRKNFILCQNEENYRKDRASAIQNAIAQGLELLENSWSKDLIKKNTIIIYSNEYI